MARNKLIILLWILLSQAQDLLAQENRYMVFFTDKNNSIYTTEAPEFYLSERSIGRRIKFNIPVTEQDVPVNSSYIDELKNNGVSVFYSTKWMNGVLVQTLESDVESISALPFVKNVELVAPGSKLLTQEIFNHKTGEHLGARTASVSNALQNNMLGVDEMHNQGYTGQGIMIGIFDAGFEGTDISEYFTGIFNENKIKATRDFVENGNDIYKFDPHGTGVLSTISAYMANEYIGIAYNADLVLCVTEDVETEYRIEEYNWLFAAEYADSIGVDIINTSLGYNLFNTDAGAMDYSHDNMDGNTAVITKAADMAASKGILCVVSVGNEGNDTWKTIVAPADADTILSVGAVSQTFQHVNFSSTGPTADGRIKPEVSALGESTRIVAGNGLLGYGNGTSFAAPLIAGLAAGIWQAFPDLTNVELIEVIKKGSSQYFNPDNKLGFGIPDFRNILSAITAIDENIKNNKFRIYPNPVDNHKLYVEIMDRRLWQNLEINIFDVNGRKVFFIDSYNESAHKKIELDLRHLTKGMYILNLSSLNYTGKVKFLVP